MKATTIALGLIFSLTSLAAEVPVMTIHNNVPSLHMVMSDFRINKDLGRAWVETIIDTRSNADDSTSVDSYREKVEGLSFDQNTSEIILDVEGQRVVCATVRTVGRSIFRHDKIKKTGNCMFSHVKQSAVRDNGFETYRITQVKVSIITK